MQRMTAASNHTLATRDVTPAGGTISRRRNGIGPAPAVLVAMSALSQLSPEMQAALEFDRSAIAAGEVWRLVTGQIVHFGWYHAAVNLAAFAGACWLVECRQRGCAALVGLSGILIGMSLFTSAEGIEIYRGISGVTWSLLGFLLLTMAVQDRGVAAALWVLAWTIGFGKCILEVATGRTLLPTSAPVGIEVVGTTHLVGLTVGTAFWLIAGQHAPAARP